MRGHRLAHALLALIVALVIGACGDDGDGMGTGGDGGTGPDAQPAEEAPTFVSGDFGSIPVDPLAEEVGPRTEADGVIAQSYEVRNTSREEIFEFYRDRLDEWQVEQPPQPLGEAENASWRARWVRDDRRLIVTVSDAPTLQSEGESSDDPVVQLSLSLEPRDRPLPG